MVIKSLKLKNYRNYDLLDLTFDPKTNILYGDNAQGKTNILEALYLSGTTKSHRGTKDRDIIQFGCDESHLETIVEKKGITFQIDMHLKKNSPKGIAIDKIPIRRASELFGIVNVVFFSPEDLNLIKNGPAERRKFIDLELCQLNKLYVHSLVSYNRILMQRNKLLKELFFHPEYEETLDVWDMQLVQYGKEIIKFRETFIGQLNEIIREIHRKLSGDREELQIVYDPNASYEKLEEELKRSRPQDLKQKTTLAGPHRDDIGFFIDGVDIRKFGSQGQQRTAALSLKLAEIELVKRLVRDYPILLLDDVLSELDGERQNHLLSAIDQIQTMITCTGLEDFVNNRFHIDQVFRVVNGTVILESQGAPRSREVTEQIEKLQEETT